MKPIVKTVRDTVTIHKKAKGSNDGPTVVTLQRSSDDAAGDFQEALDESTEHAGEHDDDGYEDEHDDDGYEDEHDGGDDDGSEHEEGEYD